MGGEGGGSSPVGLEHSSCVSTRCKHAGTQVMGITTTGPKTIHRIAGHKNDTHTKNSCHGDKKKSTSKKSMPRQHAPESRIPAFAKKGSLVSTKHTCGPDLSPRPPLSAPSRPRPRPSAPLPAAAALSPSDALRPLELASPGCRTRPRGPSNAINQSTNR